VSCKETEVSKNYAILRDARLEYAEMQELCQYEQTVDNLTRLEDAEEYLKEAQKLCQRRR